jgi:5-methylcytosine-specific restriction endonuclease McrA
MTDSLKVCIACGDLAQGTRCDPCRQAATARHNARRAQAGTLGASWGWRKTSQAARNREPRCQLCGTEEDLTVDHVVPRTAGGTDDRDNLRVLCRSHNAAKGTR